jgi:hypothetical protein
MKPRQSSLLCRVLFSALTAISALDFPSEAVASPLLEHIGSNDPTTEGWTLLGDNYGSPVTNDLGTGLDAWSIQAAPYQNQYRAFPSMAEAAEANTLGWQLTARLRLLHIPDGLDNGVSVEYLSETSRFDMIFGSNSNGDPIVQLWNGEPLRYGQGFGPLFTLEGGAAATTSTTWHSIH